MQYYKILIIYLKMKDKKMGNILFFDVETSGFLKNNCPKDEQSRVVQLAMMLTDNLGNLIDSFNELIIQKNPISSKAVEIHGKTFEMCKDSGVDAVVAVTAFDDFCKRADTIVGHNVGFDLNFMKSELEITQYSLVELPENRICTMRMYKNICKIPATSEQEMAGYGSIKNPRLTEAYNFCFGKDFDSAHDAMADVKATADIYLHYHNELKMLHPNAEKDSIFFMPDRQPKKETAVIVKEFDFTVAEKTPIEFFTQNGFNAVMAQSEKRIASFKGNIATKAGQAEIKSFAHSFRKAKTKITEIGDTLIANLEKPIEDQKKQIQSIKSEMRRIIAFLEEKYTETRKELTALEEAEKHRIKLITDKIAEIKQFKSHQILTQSDADKIFEEIKQIEFFDFQEFKPEAYQEIETTFNFVNQIRDGLVAKEEVERLKRENQALEQEKRIEIEVQKRTAEIQKPVVMMQNPVTPIRNIITTIEPQLENTQIDDDAKKKYIYLYFIRNQVLPKCAEKVANLILSSMVPYVGVKNEL